MWQKTNFIVMATTGEFMQRSKLIHAAFPKKYQARSDGLSQSHCRPSKSVATKEHSPKYNFRYTVTYLF